MQTQMQTGAPRQAREPRPGGRFGRDPDELNWINVRFEAGPSAAAAARAALSAVERRIDPEVMEDVRLLVSELVTNSVRHSDAAPSDPVRLDVEVDARRVRVEVCDPGSGFELRPRDPDHTKVGGWGLYLVERLADRWGVVRDNLTRVWFEIDRGSAAGGRVAEA